MGTDDAKKRRRITGERGKQSAGTAGGKEEFTGEDMFDAPAKGCTMRLTYMFRQHPCTVIDVDFLAQKIWIQNMTDDPVHRAFGIIEHPTWEDFEAFLRERCFPETRGNKKALLRELGLTDYDPLQIVEKTQGRMADDDLWLKFRYMEREAE